MKIEDKKGYTYLRIYGTVPVKHGILDEGFFPLNIGSVTITSKDGKRDFIYDPYTTDFSFEEDKLTFVSKMEIDKDTFSKKDGYKYDLLEEDLETAKVEFFCEKDLEASADYSLDKAEFTIQIQFEEDEKMYELKAELEN